MQASHTLSQTLFPTCTVIEKPGKLKEIIRYASYCFAFAEKANSKQLWLLLNERDFQFSSPQDPSRSKAVNLLAEESGHRDFNAV